MKINNDALKALQQAERSGEAHRKPKIGEDGFDALFAEQVQNTRTDGVQFRGTAAGKAEGQEGSASLAMLMATARQLGGLDDGSEASLEESLIQDSLRTEQAAARMDGLLDQWDQYANTLKGQGGDLKSLYGLLRGMGQEVTALKGSGLVRDNETMGSLLNELEILTTTETIKFNRGDYL